MRTVMKVRNKIVSAMNIVGVTARGMCMDKNARQAVTRLQIEESALPSLSISQNSGDIGYSLA